VFETFEKSRRDVMIIESSLNFAGKPRRGDINFLPSFRNFDSFLDVFLYQCQPFSLDLLIFSGFEHLWSPGLCLTVTFLRFF